MAGYYMFSFQYSVVGVALARGGCCYPAAGGYWACLACLGVVRVALLAHGVVALVHLVPAVVVRLVWVVVVACFAAAVRRLAVAGVAAGLACLARLVVVHRPVAWPAVAGWGGCFVAGGYHHLAVAGLAGAAGCCPGLVACSHCRRLCLYCFSFCYCLFQAFSGLSGPRRSQNPFLLLRLLYCCLFPALQVAVRRVLYLLYFVSVFLLRVLCLAGTACCCPKSYTTSGF